MRFIGGGWAVTAALLYAVGLGIVTAMGDRSGLTQDSVSTGLAVAVPAAVVGVVVAIPLGLVLGAVLGAVLRRRPRSPRRGALLGAGVGLAGTAPLVGLLALAVDLGLVLYLGVLPARCWGWEQPR